MRENSLTPWFTDAYAPVTRDYNALFLIAGKNERDLVVLYHDIGVLWPGNRYEKKLVTLVSYGETNGYTAMAKTVGIPTAIAAIMVLQGM